MRILCLNHNVAGSGTYQRAFNLARALGRRGHAVTLVTTSRSARVATRWVERRGVSVLEAPDLWWGPARTGWDPWNVLRRFLALRGRDFDLVHAFDSRPVVIGPALAVRHRTGAPLFMDWADWWGRGGWIRERSAWPVRTFFGPIETWFEEAFRGRAVGTTTVSETLARRAEGLGVDRRRILVEPNGCDPDGVVPVDRVEARRRLGLAPDSPMLVHLGVLTPGDMELLAGAVRRVRRSRPEATLALVGRPRARPPADLERAGAVVRTGFVATEALPLWLGAADACVLALRNTLGHRARWPGKVNDYLSAGRAVVTPEVGAAAALVRREGLGWTSAPEPEALGEAMLRALADRAAADRAGERARALAEGRLAWREVAERLERFYGAVLAGTGAAVAEHELCLEGNDG